MVSLYRWENETQVNVVTVGHQDHSAQAVSLDSSAILFAYRSTPPAGVTKIVFSVRNALGAAYFTKDVELYSGVLGTAGQPIVTALSNGNFAIAWAVGDSSPSVGTAVVSGYGTVIRSNFNMTPTSSGDQVPTGIAATANGGFVVSYSSTTVNGKLNFTQAVDAKGFAVGGEAALASGFNARPDAPQLVRLSDGQIVAIYHNSIPGWLGQQPFSGLSMHVLTPEGQAPGQRINLSAFDGVDVENFTVTALDSGRFLLVGYSSDSAASELRGEIYDAAGQRVGSSFAINTTTPGAQTEPVAATLNDGRFVVAWTDGSGSPDDPIGTAIRAQVFNADGSKSGGEFLVNEYTFWNQYHPSIAVHTDGRFTISWTDEYADGSGLGIRSQTFDPRGEFDSTYSVSLTNADDEFMGRKYDDQIYARDGIDIIYSMAGNDTIHAGSGADYVEGGAGDDVIDGSYEGDFLVGGEGNDSIDGGYGDYNDKLFGNGGNDTLSGGAGGRDTLDGGEGNDKLSGSGTLSGGDGEDTIYGGSGTDILNADLIDAGSGNDLIKFVGRGSNIDGGSGRDILDLDNTTIWSPAPPVVGVTIDLTTGANSMGFTLARLEDVRGTLADDDITGTAGDNDLRGNSGNDILNGLDGFDALYGGDGFDKLYGGRNGDILSGDAHDDTLDGGAGADVMTGGEGNDVYYVDDANDNVSESAGQGSSDLVYTFISFTLNATEVENLTGTGTANIALTGNGIANVITGNSGNNTLNGAGGADAMNGGLGDDTYIIDATDTVTEASNSGIDTVLVSSNYTLKSSFEILKAFDPTSKTNLILTGNFLNNTIVGGAGDDILDGVAGSDELYGGKGNDTYSVRETQVPGSGGVKIFENENEGLNDVVLTDVSYTLSSDSEIESLIARVATDTSALSLTGNRFVNTIVGNDGSNSLDGGLGDDSLSGGDGDDTYYVDSLLDTVVEGDGKGTDTIVSLIDYTLAGGSFVENLTANIMAGNVKMVGNEKANVVTGNDADNTLDGAGGDDTLIGNGGKDLYLVDSLGDKVQETAVSGAANVDTIQLADTATGVLTYSLVTQANVENLIAGSAGNYTLTGNVLANTIVGSSGDDLIDGGLGGDKLSGGAGNDTYTIDSLSDIVDEASNSGFDTINTRSDFTLTQDSEVEAITALGTGNLKLTGNNLANALTGNTGNNFLDGAGGGDALTGGDGDDTYRVYLATDVVTEEAGPNSGNDTIVTRFSASLVDYQNIENLSADADLTGISLTGDQFANRLTGNERANTLEGGLGADILTGGDGSDLYIIDDQDTIEELGTGIDTIVYNSSYSIAALSKVEHIDASAAVDDVELIGNGLGNALTAGSGSDSLAGGIGADTLIGGLGRDTLDGGNSNDSLVGGGGRDELTGGAGSDIMEGGEGDDIFFVDALDTIKDGSDNDAAVATAEGAYDFTSTGMRIISIQSGVANVTVNGSEGDDTITGNELANTLDGGAGNDRLDGGDGNDILLGGSDTDTLLGGEGNDVLDGGSGADRLDGGAGDDTYYIDTAGEIIADASGNDTVWVNTSYSLSANSPIENVSAQAGANVQKLTGNQNKNILTGNEQGNVLDGGGGGDTLAGGDGDDIYYINSLEDFVVEAAGAAGGNDTAYIFIGGRTEQEWRDRLQNVENIIFLTEDTIIGGNGNPNTIIGGPGNDTLSGEGGDDSISGNGGDDSIVGGDGNDTLDGGVGNDIMVGGAGNDVYYVRDPGDIIVEDIDPAIGGIDTAYIFIDEYELLDTVGVEILAVGEGVESGVSIKGNNQANTIIGGVGNDSLSGNAGDDIITGGDGDDLLEGGIGSDTLSGGIGNDILVGGAGNDTLNGGEGNDTYVFSDPDDLTTSVINDESGSADVAEVSFSLDLTQNVLSGIEVIKIAQGAGNITLTGNSDANTLIGNQVSNTLIGGAGNDTLQGGDGADMLQGGDDDDMLQGGLDNDHLVGGNGIDFLDGGEGNDYLDSTGLGSDTLQGGTGNDIYVIRHGDDTVIEDLDGALGGTQDTAYIFSENYADVNVYVQWLKNNGVENVFVNKEPPGPGSGNQAPKDVDLSEKSVRESAGNNIPIGTLSAFDADGDTLTYTLVGEAANEVFSIDASTNELKVKNGLKLDFEQKREWPITILVDDGKGGVTTKEFTIEVRNSFRDLVTGTTADEKFVGGAQADRLSGMGGNDTLNGGAGVDILIGGAGADVFEFNQNPVATHTDSISDFKIEEGDRISFIKTPIAFAQIGPAGTLAQSAFHIGSAAHDADDRIIYDAAAGRILYDADGTGAGVARVVTTLSKNLSLTHDMFFIV